MKAMRLRRAFLTLAAATAVSMVAGCATTPATAKAREVLVLGGTGQLGAQIVRALLQHGEHISVLARANSDRTRLKDLSVDYLTGDLLSDADVGRAMRAKKFNVVVNAVRVEDGDIHFYEKILRPITAHAKATRYQNTVEFSQPRHIAVIDSFRVDVLNHHLGMVFHARMAQRLVQ